MLPTHALVLACNSTTALLPRQGNSRLFDRPTDLPPPKPIPSHSAIRHLLPSPLLHLGLSLARRRRLGHTRSILIPTPHTRVRSPRGIDAIRRNYNIRPPSLVAKNGSQNYTQVGPVGHVPEVFCETGGGEIVACARNGAVGVDRGAGGAFKGQVDEGLWGGEQDVDDERAAGQGAEEQAEDPVEGVDTEGDVEGGV